jgi:hypothetical protein
MSSFSRQSVGAAGRTAVSAAELLRRRPQRVTVTIHWRLREHLQSRADEEGRSLSNLMAYLLEQALETPNAAGVKGFSV